MSDTRIAKEFLCLRPGEFEINNYEVDLHLSPGKSLIEVLQVGLCSSDFDRFYCGTSKTYPIRAGHEIFGRIANTSDFNSFAIGDLVCVYPLISCRNCKYCYQEKFYLCENYSYYGSREPGGLTNFLTVENRNVLKLNSEFPFKFGHMIEPTSVVIHAIRKFTKINANFLITGSGFLTFLAGKYLEQLGNNNFYFATNNLDFLELFDSPKRDWKNFQIQNILDFSANYKTLEEASHWINPHGEIVTVANNRDDTYISNISRSFILRKELRLSGSWNSDFKSENSDWIESINFLTKLTEFEFPIQPIKFERLADFLNKNNRESTVGKRYYVKF